MSMSFYGAKVFFHVKLLLPLLCHVDAVVVYSLPLAMMVNLALLPMMVFAQSWPPRSRVLCVLQTPDPCL
jgi:hypothetical protein